MVLYQGGEDPFHLVLPLDLGYSDKLLYNLRLKESIRRWISSSVLHNLQCGDIETTYGRER